MTPEERIQALARACARARLDLKSSRGLFDRMYCADAIMVSNGRIDKAAELAGVNREAVVRIMRGLRNPVTIEVEEDDNELSQGDAVPRV